MSFRRLLIPAIVVLAALPALFAFMGSGSTSTAVLVTATGEHEIEVEVVNTPEGRATGLMNRPSMPERHGMLFDFGDTREVTMWMKNTRIPLDMLFMDEAGRVTRIATNAQPLSLDLISSGGPIRYVLELNGGEAAELGAESGDRLRHSSIPTE